VSDIEPSVVMSGTELPIVAQKKIYLLTRQIVSLNKTSNVTTNNEGVICEIDYKQEQ
jgi:hypothetical protein